MTDPKLLAQAKKLKADKKLAVQRARRLAAEKKKLLGTKSTHSPVNLPRAQRDVSPAASARRAETSRLRIKTSMIIDRVQKHAMGTLDMTPTQLAAAQALLRKTLPDLVGVKAEIDVSPVVFNFAIPK